MTNPTPLTPPRADAFARALARRELDPNELAKAFTHLRSFLSQAEREVKGEGAAREEAHKRAQAQAVAEWWRWLDAVTGSGARAVIRSGRTQDYLKAIRAAAHEHLRGLEPEALAQALGWGVRLVRYYRFTEGALNKPTPFELDDNAEGAAETPRAEARRPAAPDPAPTPHVEPPRPPKPAPAAPTLPEVGGVFKGTVSNLEDPQHILIEVPGFAVEQALGAMPKATLEGKQYHPGNPVWVAVTGSRVQADGRTILVMRPVSKAERKKKVAE